jgi:hypothetical protein
MEEGKWCYSLDEEYYSGSEETREDAIAEAVGCNDLEVGDALYIGTAEPVDVRIDTAQLIENILDDVEQECEVGGWPLYDISPKSEPFNELDKALNDVFKAWMKKHKLEPNFYKVCAIERVTVTKEMLP